MKEIERGIKMEKLICLIILALIATLIIDFIITKISEKPLKLKYVKVTGISECNVTREQILEDEKEGIIHLCKGDPLGVKNFTIVKWINDTTYEWEAEAIEGVLDE
jgi:hypothetical protein